MKKNRLFLYATVVAVWVGLMIGINAVPAQASATYTVESCPMVTNNDGQQLGTIRIDIPNVAVFWGSTNYVSIGLPYGVFFPNYQSGMTVNPADVEVVSPEGQSVIPQAAIRPVYEGMNAVAIQVDGNQLTGINGSGVIYVNLKSANVTYQNGDIRATFFAPANGFSNGEAVVARCEKPISTVSISNVNEVNCGSSQPIGPVFITELIRSALRVNDSCTITLPQGYTWDASGIGWFGQNGLNGFESAHWNVSLSGRTLTFTVLHNAEPVYSAGRVSIGWESSPLKINVPADATAGNVVCEVNGTGSIQSGSLTVASVKQGQIQILPISYAVISVPTVQPANGQELGGIKIDIPTPMILMEGDVFTVHLPSEVTMPNFVQGGPVNPNDVAITIGPADPGAGTASMTESNWSICPVGPSTIEFRLISKPATNYPSRIVILFKSMNVTVPSGDIYMMMVAPQASAFRSGSYLIAKVVPATFTPMITASISSINTIQRSSSQPIGRVLIQEQNAGSIRKGKAVTLRLPAGYSWDNSNLAVTGAWNFSSLDSSAWGVTRNGSDLVITMLKDAAAYSSQGRLYLDNLMLNVPAGATATDVLCTITCTGQTSPQTMMIAKLTVPADVKAKADSISHTVTNGTKQALGVVTFSLPKAEALVVGDAVDLSLPAGVTFPHYVYNGTVNPADVKITVTGDSGNQTAISENDLRAVMTAQNAFRLKIINAPKPAFSGPAQISISFRSMNVSGQKDYVFVTAAPAGASEVFVDTSSLRIGMVASQTRRTGRIGLEMKKLNTWLRQGQLEIGGLAINEQNGGTIQENDSFSLELPDGCVWDASGVDVSGEWSFKNLPDSAWQVTANGRTLVIKQTKVPASGSAIGRVVFDGLRVNPQAATSAGDLIAKITAPVEVEQATLTIGRIAPAEAPKPEKPKANRVIEFKLGAGIFTMNGKAAALDAPAIVDKAAGRTLAPLRAMGEALGATVEWRAKTEQIVITYESSRIVLKIGSKTAYVNGVSKQLEAAPTVNRAGRTLIPLRFVSEVFGASVDFDAAAGTIRIAR